MRYIVRLEDSLAADKIQAIENLGGKIIFQSIFIPIIGIEINHIERIKNLKYVKNIRIPREGNFEKINEIQHSPFVNSKLLCRNNLIAWGDTRIAILDSGINQSEVDINIVETRDFTESGILDKKNHGTLVTKIIRDFARGANLYIAKVGEYKPDEIWCLDALQWAYAKGAKIINLSLGFEKTELCEDNCDVCQTVNAIAKEGVAIVVAAGNNNNKIDSIDCPGIATNSITVGSVNENLSIAKYSSFDKIGGNKPNLLAPGTIVINRNENKKMSGTSFSAPIISGILGCIINTTDNIDKCLEYIYGTAKSLGLPANQQGVGCIDLNKIIEVIKNEKENSIKSKGQDQSS